MENTFEDVGIVRVVVAFAHNVSAAELEIARHVGRARPADIIIIIITISPVSTSSTSCNSSFESEFEFGSRTCPCSCSA